MPAKSPASSMAVHRCSPIMIKAVAKLPDGREVLVIGLSRRNTELLLDGKPISFNLADLGVDGPNVVLIGGETEALLVEQLTVIMGRGVEIERKDK